jgi:hypothetical protein
MKPISCRAPALALLLSGSACIVPSLGATTDVGKVASLRGRLIQEEKQAMQQEIRSLQNPVVGTYYCYPVGNSTQVDCAPIVDNDDNYFCSRPQGSCEDSQQDALAAAQGVCSDLKVPYLAVTYVGGGNPDCAWMYECCAAQHEGAARELGLQSPTNDADEVICYRTNNNNPINCTVLDGHWASCTFPPYGDCGIGQYEALGEGQEYCSENNAPFVIVKKLTGGNCNWMYECCNPDGDI